jgi:diacylglycerol O-acyltransferase
MDSLSALDAEFLHLEDDVATVHIGGVAVLAGPAPTYDEFVAMLGAKLHLIPRYRQRVATVPLELGRPVWVDDPHFSIGFHIRHTALPAPGDDAALDRLVGRLMGHRLDRNRPLWEIWMVEGLAEGRWALVFKVHHCMVDGIAGVGLLSAVLDLFPDAEVPEAPPWAPAPEPGPVAKVAHAWRGLAGDVARRAVDAPAALAHPAETARATVDGVRGLLGWGRHVTPLPALSIEGAIGPHRSWARTTTSLADIKAIRNGLGGTLNDVVVTAITAGLRDLLVAHGDDPDTAVVRTLVPVSVRREDGDGVADNRVSGILLELPVHVADPLERLAAVQAACAAGKASHMAELGEAVTHAADLLPPMVLGTASRLIVRLLHHVPQQSITTVCTNVPGPQFPLYCLGREMLDYLPYVPLMDGVRVGTAILSYNGKVAFGVTGDLDSVPDVAVVTDGIVTALGELRALAAPPPARSRSRRRAPAGA